MLDSVGSTGTGGGTGAVRAVAAAAPVSTPQTQTGVMASAPLSPRMRADPVAGVLIAEYLTTDGKPQMQFPSTTVVAYLRSGLSENGMNIPSERPSVTTEA